MNDNPQRRLRRWRSAAAMLAVALLASGALRAAEIEVFHADSLAGPMRALKAAFEAKNAGTTVKLTSGVSKELAERILKGETCDVFAPSSPAVIAENLMGKQVAGTGKPAATWYLVFSANEMVVIVAKGNPRGVRQAIDLAGPGIRVVRVTGEKDLATGRTLEFLKRAATVEGVPEAAAKIAEKSRGPDGRALAVADVVSAVTKGEADAGIVYYSAAVAARDDVDIIRFPALVNLSEVIRNAATVPGTAREPATAVQFVAFLVSREGRDILREAGQPAIIPALREGDMPPNL